MEGEELIEAIQPESFLYEERGPIAVITFNRPERLNSLTFEVYRELTETFQALRDQPNIRVVVMTGQGRGFCSGGDVNEIIGELFSRDAEGLREFTRLTCRLIYCIRSLGKPVIASLNGVVAGAGAVIALSADYRIAAESARIAFLFAKVGLSGADMGAAFLLPRLIGLSRATEMLFEGEFLPASRALEWGLYGRVVSSEALEAETMKLAQKLAAGPGFALSMTKSALNRELNMSLESALEAEAEVQALCMMHADFREAYQAFVDKRPPEFNR